MAFTFLTANQEDGFSEALLRGLRSSFLTDLDYSNLKEGGQRGGAGGGGGAGAASAGAGGAAVDAAPAREDFEDLRLTLQETDYGNFLQAEPALDPKIIATRATQKWVFEFKYVRAGATGRLARFLDFVAMEYVIDNILDLIKAATSSASVDMQAVVENCHPLGMLEPAVMRSILAYEDLGEDFLALYRTILVDTPVGKYFTMFLQETVDEKAAMDPDAVRSTFAEIPMTLIENSVKKFYLEDFFRFCKEEVGGETGCVPAPRLLRPPPPTTTPPLPPEVRPPSPFSPPFPLLASPPRPPSAPAQRDHGRAALCTRGHADDQHHVQLAQH
jgi:V-type H+-transporting ATPase subunit d